MNIAEDLATIDTEIRRLKIQYDLYFTGALPRPPSIQRGMVNRMLKRYEGVHIRNAAHRFLFNNLVNKFNVFSELWNRGVRRQEEGDRKHPLATRAERRAAAESTPPPTPKPPAARPAAGKTPAAWRVSANQRDDPSIKGLYENFLSAGKQAGSARQPSFENFAKEIARQTAALKQKRDCEAVDFRIYCEGNKVKIKARPAS